MQEKIIILDFGSQTTQLIGRRVRELNVYCEIVPYNKFPQGDESVKGVILSGSPFSVYDESAFKIDLNEIRGKYPVLGICYGAQFIAYTNGGKVEPAGSREYGRAHLNSFDKGNVLFKGVKENTQVWMSHGDTITAIPDNFKTIASTDKVKIAAYQVEGEKMWGVQFHPEVFHSEDGTQMLKNFVVEVCGCKQDWSAASFIETTVAQLKEQLGDDKVVLGLSGGVDSSVAAYLLKQQGYDVIGVTMQIWQDEDQFTQAESGGCCGLSAVDDARRVADRLEIPYYVMNFKREFKKNVMDYFTAEYLKGRTPNPCIACNRYVKWESLLQRSLEIGADYIATGHYARVEQLSNGRYAIRNSVTAAKDQTYALFNLTQKQLSHTLMPV